MKHAPLTPLEVRRICALRADGYTCSAVGKIIGCSGSTVRNYAPGRPGKVSNDRLREEFLALNVSASAVARYLGWTSVHGADTSRVRRTLGLLDDINGAGRRSTRRLIDWETGSLIAEAIGVAAWSVLDDDAEAAA